MVDVVVMTSKYGPIVRVSARLSGTGACPKPRTCPAAKLLVGRGMSVFNGGGSVLLCRNEVDMTSPNTDGFSGLIPRRKRRTIDGCHSTRQVERQAAEPTAPFSELAG